MKCDVCNKQIIGQYIQYRDLNLNICKSCNNKIPKCRMCNAPLLNEPKGAKFCKKCKKSLKVCASCGKYITGAYYTYNKKYYCENCGIRCIKCGKKITSVITDSKGQPLCEDCYKKNYAPRCAGCGKILDKYIKADNGKNYCNPCYKKNFGEVCYSCGKKVLEYVKLDNRVYCKICAKDKTCVSCSMPIGKDGLQIDVGLYSCKDCYSNSIQRQVELDKIYKSIISLLQSKFNMKFPNLNGGLQFQLI